MGSQANIKMDYDAYFDSVFDFDYDYNQEDVVAVECKHTLYGKSRDPSKNVPDDCVFVKERLHLKDGRTVPNTRMYLNPKRPFWVTKPGFRKHKEKKDWEKLEKLSKFECTQAELPSRIKRALGGFVPGRSLRQICNNPYVYGADIPITAIIKRKYMDRYPDISSHNTVAILDIETDVVSGKNRGAEDPILISVTMKDKVYVTVDANWLESVYDAKVHKGKTLSDIAKDYVHERLEKYITERNLKVVIDTCVSPLEMIERSMAFCHKLKPDFLAIWNMNFDIPRLLEVTERYGGNVNKIFTDPSVPAEFRNVRYQMGAAKKVTQNGKEMAKLWVDRWHTLHALTSFYVIDQACVFRKLRVAGGQEPSYALDEILRKHAGISKLKGTVGEHLKGLEWHQFMQTKEKLEYVAYNIFDCLGCEILDEQPKVLDLAVAITSQCGHSDYGKFDSQPRRTVDDLHFFCLDHGYAIATTPEDLTTHFDEMVVNIRKWIVTLPSYLIMDNGQMIIEEFPGLTTLIHFAVYDLDITAAYPNGEDILNASKSTTIAEVSKIEGISHQKQRELGLNLTAGVVNSTEICVTYLQAPTLDELEAAWDEEFKEAA